MFEEYQRLQRELEREPVEFLSLKRRFPELIADVRERLAAYVGVAVDDLILVPNATAAVNAVARSLDLQPGDEIVATTHEYGGNELLWRYTCERRGARYVEIETTPATAADDLLGAALDLATLGADFYAGNCHKWLCAPKGAGFLYAGKDVQRLLEPLAMSWDSVAVAWADRYRWTGTHDPSPHLAVPAAIDFQTDNHWDGVRHRCHELAARASQELSELLGTEPLAAYDDEFVQMAAVHLPPCDAEALTVRLYRERRIEILAQTWRGRPILRVSFQAYNDDNDLDALLAALPTLL